MLGSCFCARRTNESGDAEVFSVHFHRGAVGCYIFLYIVFNCVVCVVNYVECTWRIICYQGRYYIILYMNWCKIQHEISVLLQIQTLFFEKVDPRPTWDILSRPWLTLFRSSITQAERAQTCSHGGHSGPVTQSFCSPPNFVVPRIFLLKHVIKTKVFLP